jgi:CheY-like chemotaxis protein/HPt (histidine-containing phosphotransfer) domain-containing protein
MSSEAVTSEAKQGLLEQAANIDWAPEQSAPEDIEIESLRHRGVDRLTIKLQPQKTRGGLFGLFSSKRSQSKHMATLSISDETLSIETAAAKTNVKMHDIEALALNHDIAEKASQIVLTASNKKTTFGQGLSTQSLTWLRDRLLLEAAGLMWKPIFHIGRRSTAKTVCPENDTYLAWTNANNSLIQFFVSEAPERAKELNGAIQGEDWNTASKSASWLKSTCAVVGAGYLSELCQRIELEASTEERERMPVLAQHFRTEFTKVLKRLCDISSQDVPAQAHFTDSDADRAVSQAEASAQVLLVEDSVFNQMVATSLLEDAGHQVTVASHGNEALEQLEEGSFDLILMDCQMPVLDGFETTKKIRSREFRLGRARTPIIALTAHALQDDKKRCLSVDMDDYLSKPYSPDELLAVVDRWLNPPPFFLTEEEVASADAQDDAAEVESDTGAALTEPCASDDAAVEASESPVADDNESDQDAAPSPATLSDDDIAAALAPEPTASAETSDDAGASGAEAFEEKASIVA